MHESGVQRETAITTNPKEGRANENMKKKKRKKISSMWKDNSEGDVMTE